MNRENPAHRALRWTFTIALTIFGVFFVAYMCPKLIAFFLPVIFAWLVTKVSEPLVRFLKTKLHLKAKLSTGIVMVLIVLLVGGLLGSIGFFLVKELIGFIELVPRYVSTATAVIDSMEAWLTTVVDRVPDYIIKSVDELETRLSEIFLNAASTLGTHLAERIGGWMGSVPSLLVYLVIILLMTFFMLSDGREAKRSLYDALPAFVKNFLNQCKISAKKALSGYFMTQLKLSWIVALILLVGFLIMRVPYAFFLALLVAFVDFLPIFGSGTVLLPWAAAELFMKDYWDMAGLLILYGLTQGMKQLLSPKMMGDSMGFPPLASVFCLFLGFKIWGIGGMIFAIPLGMMIVEICKMGVFDPCVGCLKEMVTAVGDVLKKPEAGDTANGQAEGRQLEVMVQESGQTDIRSEVGTDSGQK